MSLSTWNGITRRANGGTVIVSWWNTIMDALIAFFGGGAIFRTSFTITNNSGPTVLAGMTCDSALYRTIVFYVDIYRKTDTAASEKRSTGIVTCQWSIQNSSWSIVDEQYSGAGDHGITWTLTGTTTLQLNITVSNLAGANHTGTAKISAETYDL